MHNKYLTGVSVISIGLDRSMPECNQEEADTRIVVHILHAIQADQVKSVVARTVDTNIIVILIGKIHYLRAIQPVLDLWVGYRTGRNFSIISINIIYSGKGEPRWRSLPVFHALTGCDTTSTFYGKSRKSAWQAWELYPGVTSTFEFLTNNPFQQLTVDSEHSKRIERFTVILFDKLSPLDSINKARMGLFCKNNRDMGQALPPTQVT